MDVIANYLEGKEPPKSVPDLASTAKYLNLPWLVRYGDTLYDWIVRMRNPNLTWNNSINWQYLLEAAETGKSFLVEYLLQKGVEPFRTVRYQDADFLFRLDHMKEAKSGKYPDQVTCPPFRKAVEKGQVEVVKVLLAQTAI